MCATNRKILPSVMVDVRAASERMEGGVSISSPLNFQSPNELNSGFKRRVCVKLRSGVISVED